MVTQWPAALQPHQASHGCYCISLLVMDRIAEVGMMFQFLRMNMQENANRHQVETSVNSRELFRLMHLGIQGLDVWSHQTSCTVSISTF